MQPLLYPMLIPICIIVGLVLIFWVIRSYNSLRTLLNRVETQFAQIDVTLQARADLIPNLTETVRGYAGHEKATLEAVIAARSAALSAATPAAKMAANRSLESSLGKLLGIAESYPELKANAVFQQLQVELARCEKEIQYSRQFYNDTVNKYHDRLDTFPTNIIASMFHFRHATLFITTEGDRNTPRVSF